MGILQGRKSVEKARYTLKERGYDRKIMKLKAERERLNMKLKEELRRKNFEI